MKRTYLSYILLGIIFLCALVVKAAAQSSPGNHIYVDVYDMATDGDSIYVDFDIILKNYRLGSSFNVLFTPVVSNNAGAIYELPSILVEGKKRAKLNRRILSLKGRDVTQAALYGRTVLKADPVSETIPYAYTFPYQPWMANARLDVLVDKCGCGISGGDLEQSLVATMPEPVTGPYVFMPELHFIVPQKEAKKDRVENGTAYITFPVGKHAVLPGFGNNAAELDKIRESMDYIKGEPTTIIDHVTIKAYASPEGNDAGNNLLSTRRAESLKTYVQQHYRVPGRNIHSEGMGENWEGLLDMIGQDLSAPYRDEVLHVLRDFSIEEGRESKLMALHGGHPYRYILQVHYPKLRRSDYEIKYTVPGFDVDKAKEVLQTRPGMLSLEEMFLIAQTYEKGSAEFNRVFDTAARLFPGDKTANLNAAAASLYKGDFAYAEEILQHYTNDPDAWNNIGVLRIRQMRPDEAEDFLLRARHNGDREAAKNLEAVDKLRAYIVKITPLAERKKARRSTK